MNAPRGRLVASRELQARNLGSAGWIAWLDTYERADGTRTHVRLVGARRLGTTGYARGDMHVRHYRRQARTR